MGTVTSRVPFSAAVHRSSPSWMCRNMFSITTMLSSTTRPTAIARPPRVNRFRLMPCHAITINAASTLAGMEMLVTSVGRTLKRNVKITITASTAPSSTSCVSSLMDFWIPGAWLEISTNCTSEGRPSSKPFSLAVTALDTSTVLPSGSFSTLMVRLGSPLVRVMVKPSPDPRGTSAPNTVTSHRVV